MDERGSEVKGKKKTRWSNRPDPQKEEEEMAMSSDGWFLSPLLRKCGLWTSSAGLPWEVVRNANSQVPPQSF